MTTFGKVLFLSLFVFPVVSSATVVTTADCTLDATKTCATGISGLDVNGSIYDVQFVVNGSYNTVYATTPSPFIGDISGATAATVAMRQSLEAAGVDGVLSYSLQADFFLVPTAVSSTAVGFIYGFLQLPRTNPLWADSFACQPETGDCFTRAVDLSSELPTASYNWAVFSDAAVPAPATLGLLAVGLMGFGFNHSKHRMFTAKS